jgi:hypothetical protein
MHEVSHVRIFTLCKRAATLNPGSLPRCSSPFFPWDFRFHHCREAHRLRSCNGASVFTCVVARLLIQRASLFPVAGVSVFYLPAEWQISRAGFSPVGNICNTPRGAPARRGKERGFSRGLTAACAVMRKRHFTKDDLNEFYNETWNSRTTNKSSLGNAKP